MQPHALKLRSTAEGVAWAESSLPWPLLSRGTGCRH